MGQRHCVQRFQRRSEVPSKGTFRGTFEGTFAGFKFLSFWMYVPTSVHTSIKFEIYKSSTGDLTHGETHTSSFLRMCGDPRAGAYA